MYCLAQNMKSESISPGLTRRILARGGGMMAVEVRFAAGTAAPSHSHPHEQISYILAGKFEAWLGGEKAILAAGDTYYVPPGVKHHVTALEDAVILDVFTPQREDLLGGS